MTLIIYSQPKSSLSNDNINNSDVVKKSSQAPTPKHTYLEQKDPVIPVCEQLDDSETEREREKEEILSFTLSSKDSPALEEQLFYTLTTPLAKGENRLDMLISFNQKFKRNKLSHWRLLIECNEANNINLCDDNILSSIKITDRSNAAIWVGLANLYAQRGNTPKALTAMYEATKATKYSDFLYEELEFFEQTLANSTSLNLIDKINFGLTQYHLKSMRMLNLFELCDKSSSVADDVANACVALGQKMERLGSTISSRKNGLFLQKITHQKTNNIESLKKIEEKLNTFNLKSQDPNLFRALQLLQHDDKLLQTWFKTLSISNEVEATDKLLTEALLLAQNEYYDPCNINDN